MRKTRETALSSIQEYTMTRQNTIRRRHSNTENNVDNEIPNEATPLTNDVNVEPEPEVIWLRRDEVYTDTPKTFGNTFEMEQHSNHAETVKPAAPKREAKVARREHRTKTKINSDKSSKPCHIKSNITPKEGDVKSETYYRKLIVAEWQRVAAVVDRVLFWVYFIGTIVSYLVILIIIPRENYALWDAKIQQTPYVRSDSRYTM